MRHFAVANGLSFICRATSSSFVVARAGCIPKLEGKRMVRDLFGLIRRVLPFFEEVSVDRHDVACAEHAKP